MVLVDYNLLKMFYYIYFLYCIPKTNLSNHKINYKHKSKEPKKFTVCLVAVHFLVKGYKNVIFGVRKLICKLLAFSSVFAKNAMKILCPRL